ncbi:hypothetical protein ACFOLC_10250 [Lysobacter cavernae]|uniref:Uncharacterized protein n=1 Tax=Lysobacter cavernae TaxID=1685901 RepID=A0ABV7RTT3_9GAMM
MSSKLKSRVFAFAAGLATLAGAGAASAQDFTFGWNPRSGDVWVDTWLSDVNRYGTRYREPFVDEMVRYYGAPRDLVSELLVRRHWAPGDVYYACAIAQILGRPCRYVVDEWDRNHGQGWGAVAKNLGIKPGSPEFHRLKRGFVPTYDRWARPITIDADLHNDFPNRAKAGNNGKLPDRAKVSPQKGKPAQAAKGADKKSTGSQKGPGDKGQGGSKGKGKDKGGSDKH